MFLQGRLSDPTEQAYRGYGHIRILFQKKCGTTAEMPGLSLKKIKGNVLNITRSIQ